MNTKGIAHAIAGIESELENLKAHAGLSIAEDEDEEEPRMGEARMREVGRGRKKKFVPSIAEAEEEE